ncbi:MAG: ATP-binding protein [Acidobacteria bacterium]|nr:MAG: ATP-binding protein [Acidobacteriota bacterium]
MQNYEQLGLFYLGAGYDLQQKKRTENLILYDSKDLVTHAVCVGMTGSGKTGLCIGLLEEAAIDNIPSIVIDPKGDLSNLLLTFPDLKSQDFAPWVNQDEDPAQKAEMWKNGLASWGEDGNRIRRLRESAEFVIYTPGSNAGVPVSVMKSFTAPGAAVIQDPELLSERVTTTATSLLTLIGLQGSPVQSREHILISTLLNNAWRQGQDLDLAALIQQIQNPPVTRIGVMELETFYPSKERFSLAMQMNNLLAAPGFENWMQGEALDAGAFLYTKSGKPKVSIFSISHLSDSERMFFVSLLLSQVLAWIRTQSGTTSLRALLYMDEIFGYFPPVSNPPSKGPLLTLLKQARAFGLGIVLATQNPVDLDYKGLANAGTWFIGRLQTEQDKARVLDGLQGASGVSFDRAKIESILGSLSNRVFLMNNVHEDAPVVFQTRWTLSYLRGPLTREQIKVLMADRKAVVSPAQGQPQTSVSKPAAAKEIRAGSSRPVLPSEIPQYYLPPIAAAAAAAATDLFYEPKLLARGKAYYADAKVGVASEVEIWCEASFLDAATPIDWDQAEKVVLKEADLEKFPHDEASYGELPASATKAKSYDAWKKSFVDWLVRNQKLTLLKSLASGQVSKPGESEADFRVRLQQQGREQRDTSVDRIRQKYAARLDMLQQRILRAQQAVSREAEQAKAAKLQTAISFGTTILGALLGRKTISATNIGRATTAARGVGRSMKESSDIDRAQENVDQIKQQLADLQSQMQAEVDDTAKKTDPTAESLQTVEILAKKTNISVPLLALVWIPHWKE